MKIRARLYADRSIESSRWFTVESFGVSTRWYRYAWFGRFCIYVRTARP
ncbi:MULTISPECIES: hypothetical protein [unclassified Cryobacterium]|nr:MULTISPECIES: hypothetical protein [unclassified Cryobacterium]